MALCECGAPPRGLVCQRGHRLEETWGPAARAAALVARRKREHDSVKSDVKDWLNPKTDFKPLAERPPDKKEKVVPEVVSSSADMLLDAAGLKLPLHDEEQPGENHLDRVVKAVTKQVHHRARFLGKGKAVRVATPEGDISMRHVRGVGPFSVWRVEGGGHHVHEEQRRASVRMIMGKKAASREVAERVRDTRHADVMHDYAMVSRVAKAKTDKPVTISSVTTDHKATITPTKEGKLRVEHPGGVEEHTNPMDAVRAAKRGLRAAGGRVLEHAKPGQDPLEHMTTGPSMFARRLAANPGAVERWGEFLDDAVQPDSSDGFKGWIRDKIGLGDTLPGHVTDPTTWVPGTFPTDPPEGADVMMHHAGDTAALVHHAMTAAAPHVDAIHAAMHHALTLVAARWDAKVAAELQLREAAGGEDVVQARIRLRVLERELDEAGDAFVRWLNNDEGEHAEEAMMDQCPKCGAPVKGDKAVCQRGHRIEEAWSAASREAALAARKAKGGLSMRPGNDRSGAGSWAAGGGEAEVKNYVTPHNTPVPLSVIHAQDRFHTVTPDGQRMSSHATQGEAEAHREHLYATDQRFSANVAGGVAAVKNVKTARDVAPRVPHGPFRVNSGAM